MRQLHVVALSEDGRFLLLAPTKDATKGAFKVPVDARLTAAVRGELPRPGQTAAPVSGLTPKEIQARLRAGETVEQVARAAGVPPARVERFAGPVEGERARTIDAARAAVLTRARRGASAVSLGDAVTAHLADAGVDPGEVEWTARREDDGSWLVAAAFSVRGRKKRSTWRYEPGTRELSAIDASSAVLGYVEPLETERRPTTKTISPVRAGGRSSRSSRRTTLTERRSAAAPQVPAAVKAPDIAAPAQQHPGGRTKKAAAPVTRRTASTTPRRAAAPSPTRVPAPARRPVAPAAAKAPAAARKAPAAKAPATATSRTAKPAAAIRARSVAAKAPVSATKATASTKAPLTKKTTVRKSTPVTKKAVATRKAPARAAAKASSAPATTAATTTVRAPAEVADVRVTAPRRRRRAAASASAPPSAPEIAVKTSESGTAPDGPPQLRVVRPPEEEPRSRASVPTWADVLLSTTPPSRPAAPRDDD